MQMRLKRLALALALRGPVQRQRAKCRCGGMAEQASSCRPFGALVNFHPHVHVLATEGVFRADGAFVELPPIPEALLDITGSPPRTFRRWVEGHAAAFLADSAKDRPED